MDREKGTAVYTDGACLGNPGPGGWAWAVPGGRYASGAEALTTNQRMEIKAALEAVQALDGPLEVVSDSTYVVNCFRDRWWEGWLARGWRTVAKKPVANRDLWEPLVDAVRRDPGRVRFTWVKGHGEDAMNDLVDRLAVDAARSQQGRSGVGLPQDLGPGDVPSRRGDDPRVPAGHRLVVSGHRPPALGGYDANPVADGVRARLAEILEAKLQLHPDLVVLTGLGLGAEQLGAEA
ncbi:MAG TPA: ribonuclease H, partial [Acidimicrobiales bacterium]|nr:ribonuclease H [Acidimicrobiales bacterium]